MSNTRILLLSAIFFYYTVTTDSKKVLDMAPNAVDYMYDGCRQEAMRKFILSDLLRQEINNSVGFQKAWRASSYCSKLIPGGTEKHTEAVLAYADGGADFTNTFDEAVATMGGNVSTYENQFHFKSIHFLLMDAMSLLNRKKTCKTVHVVQEELPVAKVGSKVRFGKFTKVQTSYRALQKMEDLDGQVIFNITSCFFVNLGEVVCDKDSDMALLSPAEVFTVESANNVVDDRNESEYTEVVLIHSGLERSDNCHSLSRSPADGSTQWLVLMLATLCFLFFNY